MPLCPHCQRLSRPNILMFGDWNYLHTRSQAQRKRQNAWFDLMEYNRSRIVVVELGAGTAIPSVRHFSQSVSESGPNCVKQGSGRAGIDWIIGCKAWIPEFEMLREPIVEHSRSHL